MRGGHLDIGLLGAFEVSKAGDLANWTTENPSLKPIFAGFDEIFVAAWSWFTPSYPFCSSF